MKKIFDIKNYFTHDMYKHMFTCVEQGSGG